MDINTELKMLTIVWAIRVKQIKTIHEWMTQMTKLTLMRNGKSLNRLMTCNKLKY